MGIFESLANMSTLALIIFIVGMILIAVEMFFPGFGVAGEPFRSRRPSHCHFGNRPSAASA